MSSLDKYTLSTRSSVGPVYRQLLYDILMIGKFNNVLEIGCLRGYSSTAFCAALDDGCDFQYTICDPWPRTDFKFLDVCTKRGNIQTDKRLSLDVIQPGFDFIFIDGDHRMKYIAFELIRLVDVGAETMLAHDTHITDPRYSGAPLYRYFFSKNRDFYYVDDDTYSPEHHEVLCGLSFFTKKLDLFAKVEPLFKAITTSRKGNV